jgi:nucleotide-binding universal stress UspA family protein
VRFGMPGEVVVDELSRTHADAVVVGVDRRGYTTFTEGVSTAISLMHAASVPVLAVGASRPVDFRKPCFRILVADDLEPATAAAVDAAFALASTIGADARVRQMHVHGDLREILEDSAATSWAELKDAVRGDETPAMRAVETEMARRYDERAARLAQRGEPWRDRAAQIGVKIACDVRTGRVAEELHEAVTEFEPDLLVFGRHKALRARPFLIGRMPFRGMLHEQRAVLMVPQDGGPKSGGDDR